MFIICLHVFFSLLYLELIVLLDATACGIAAPSCPIVCFHICADVSNEKH